MWRHTAKKCIFLTFTLPLSEKPFNFDFNPLLLPASHLARGLSSKKYCFPLANEILRLRPLYKTAIFLRKINITHNPTDAVCVNDWRLASSKKRSVSKQASKLLFTTHTKLFISIISFSSFHNIIYWIFNLKMKISIQSRKLHTDIDTIETKKFFFLSTKAQKLFNSGYSLTQSDYFSLKIEWTRSTWIMRRPFILTQAAHNKLMIQWLLMRGGRESFIFSLCVCYKL